MSNLQISVIGFPLDENSSFMRGPANAPDVIRKNLESYSINLCAENGVDFRNNPCWSDVGNVELTTGSDAMDQIEESIRGLLDKGIKPLSLGGDHSVIFPIIKAFAEKYEKLNIFHIDAHPDLYDNFEDNPYSHASPFARIMENRLVNKLVQVGIRTINPAQQTQIDKFDVEVHDMINFDSSMNFDFDGPVYISIDLDGLDPAFAPGVGTPEPFGMTPYEVIQTINFFADRIVGFDCVEVCPPYDNGNTSALAARLTRHLVGAIWQTQQRFK